MLKRLMQLLVLALMAACDGTAPTEATATLPVIRAYLYAGEPVAAVQVSSTLPVNSTDSVGPPINDAAVALVRRGERFPLVPSAGDSGFYHYAGPNLVVAVHDTFDLEITALGKSATARTIVPPPPTSLTLSATTLTIPDFGAGPPSGGFDPSTFTLIARWPNAAKDSYFVVTENIEANPTPVSSSGGFVPRGRFVQAPTTADSATVISLTLTHYGRHRVTLYRVNPEYAALYESRTQDSRDLNEPASNIKGGLGVFAAFSSRSAEFTANK